MSKVEVFNLALSLCGVGRRLASPDSAGPEAEVCRLWYDRTRTFILKAAWWQCVLRTDRLALVAEATGSIWQPGLPPPRYRFAYAFPADYLYPRYLHSGAAFEVTNLDDLTPVLVTNDDEPILAYSKDQPDDTFWDPGLMMAIVHGLAAFIARGLTGKPILGQSLLQAANEIILQARASAANVDNVQYQSLPDWLEARGLAHDPVVTRYIHPYGDLLAPLVSQSAQWPR